MTTTRNSVRPQRSPVAIRFIALVLVLVGYFGPWIAHDSAALAVTGFELGEFSKFFPQVQGGVVPITRALFYFPLVAALLALVLFASRSRIRLARWAISVCVVFLLLAALLPYSVIDDARRALATRSAFVLSDTHYAKQLYLLALGITLALLAPLGARLSHRVRHVLAILLALLGSLPTLWQFATLYSLVVALYGVRPGIGWSLIFCMTGFALLLLSGILGIAISERPIRETAQVSSAT